MEQQKFKQGIVTVWDQKVIRVVIEYTAVNPEKHQNSILKQDDRLCELSANNLKVLDNESSKNWKKFFSIKSVGDVVINIGLLIQYHPTYGHACIPPFIIEERQPIKEDD